MQTHARRVFCHENSADYIGARGLKKKIIINGVCNDKMEQHRRPIAKRATRFATHKYGSIVSRRNVPRALPLIDFPRICRRIASVKRKPIRKPIRFIGRRRRLLSCVAP